jgi:predicted acylesterase/phospholipase RssA
MTLRRGLVLEGGGAKGAWQFGVLKELAERGLVFDAVSGTSVGALNGAIWSAGRIEVGNKLWSEMSLASVFLRRSWLAPALAVAGFAQLYFAFLHRFFPPDEPLPKSLEWFFSALTALPVLVLCASVSRFEFVHQDLRGMYGSLMLLFLAGSLFFDRSLARIQTLALVATLATGGIGLSLWSKEWVLIGSWHFWVGMAPVWLVGLALATRFINFSYLSPKPLAKTIELVLDSGLNVPLFVTTSREVFSYIDPDNVVYIEDNADTDFRYPLPLSTMTAAYSRIDNVSSSEAREALLASSALPFGIAPARRDNGRRRVVDGGMTDNIPWFPFIETFPCDEIIIVRCNPSTAWDEQASRDIWQRKNRLIRVIEARVKLGPVKVSKQVHNEPPIEIPYQLPAHWPAKVTVIAPTKSLGTFMKGTMNFSKQSAADWMTAGYEAAKSATL